MQWDVVKDKFEISFKYNPETVEEIKTSVEDRAWDGQRKIWTAPITPRNLFIHDLYMHTKEEDNPYWIYDQDLNPEKIKKEVEEKLPQFAEINGFKWRHGQDYILAAIFQRRRVVIAGDKRFGKTLPSLTFIEYHGIQDSWIVTTNSARPGIIREMKKWKFNFSVYIMTYSAFTQVIKTNPESVPNTIIYDEAHALKNPTSQRGSAGLEATLNQMIKYGKDYNIIALSGTPSPNDPGDWYNLLEITCAGFIYERNQLEFKKRLSYMILKDNPYGGQYWTLDTDQGLNGWREDKLKELGNKMKGLVEVFKNEDWRENYCPPEYEIVELPIDNKTKNGIRLMQKTMTGTQLYSTLRQLSDGFIYEKDIDIVTMKETKWADEYETFKDKQFAKDLDEYEDVGRLVAYGYYTHSVEKMVRVAKDKDWNILKITGKGFQAISPLDYTVDDFLNAMDASTNKGEYKKIKKLIVICQSDCGTTGQEFSASPCIIFYSNTNRWDNFDQAKARIDSENSLWKSKVWRIYIFLEIDRILFENLKAKENLQSLPNNVLAEAIKRDLNKEDNWKEPFTYNDMKVN